jgi:hypothetical protein
MFGSAPRSSTRRGGARAISPQFSAPQFCQDWIRAAGETVKNVEVRASVETGTKKNGAPRYGWRPWDMATGTLGSRKRKPKARRKAVA